MKSSILAGEFKEEVEEEFKASARLRQRLVEMLEAKADAARKQSRLVEKYENLSWAYLQADNVGYERAIYELISLLSSRSVE